MADITMQEIQQLRAKTNCGIMDCKRALQESAGDMDAAVDLLRKKGMVKAAKRSEREATEGVVNIELSSDNKKAYLIKLCSETDFVSRNDKFRTVADNIIVAMKNNSAADLETIKALKLASGETVIGSVDELSGVIGEKLELSDAKVVEAGEGETLEIYIHSNEKIGVVVSVKGLEASLAKQLCMHIAAAAPTCMAKADVDTADLDKEREILREQVLNEGKPEKIVDKIVEGKLRKYFEEVCLLEQKFVVNPDLKVSEFLGDAKLGSFVRFAIG